MQNPLYQQVQNLHKWDLGQFLGDSVHKQPVHEFDYEFGAGAPTSARPSHGGRSVAARILVGTAVIAGAATIPDISVGAMDAPYFRVDVREPSRITQQPIWSPTAGATGPTFAPVLAAKAIASDTFSSTSRTTIAKPVLPLGFLQSGSERFDLAFAGIEMPSAVALTIARERPAASVPSFRASEPAALRAQLIDVPQIGNVAQLAPPVISEVRRERPALSAVSSVDQRIALAVANASVEAAFTGSLDVSGGVREALPTAPAPQPSEPDTEASSQAIAAPSVQPNPGADNQAASELFAKSQLDARVNGVLTGSVDFQQLEGTIAIRLGSVVDMLHDRFAVSELDRISGAGALDSFVTLTQLQSAGIPIRYDPIYDEVEFGVDYDDAPNASKVQVEQIGSPSRGTDRTLMDQIPR